MAGLVVTVFFWAGNSIAGRMSAGMIPPVSLNFWRWTLAFILLLPFTGKSLLSQWPVIYRHKWLLLTLGLLSIASFNTLLYQAAQTTQALNITLIQTSLPLMTFMLSFILLKESPSKRQVVGLLLILAGLLIILTRGNLQQWELLKSNTGDFYMLVAVFAWGLYTVLLRRFSPPIGDLNLLTILIGVGIILLLPFYFFELFTVGGFALNIHSGSLLVYVTLFSSIVSYLCWNHGVKTLGSNTSSMFTSLMPVFTALIGSTLLGEPLHGYHFAGGIFIFCGLWLALLFKKSAFSSP
ncbi:DMT family transporter [Candidatus Sororendozoicomonas aggregata]|uniref:DMT family transporter n=1 Tax=Candidatus Sororendozoicomonas aggregata TaxID=3073239 RepID=UPI002ED2579C